MSSQNNTHNNNVINSTSTGIEQNDVFVLGQTIEKLRTYYSNNNDAIKTLDDINAFLAKLLKSSELITAKDLVLVSRNITMLQTHLDDKQQFNEVGYLEFIHTFLMKLCSELVVTAKTENKKGFLSNSFFASKPVEVVSVDYARAFGFLPRRNGDLPKNPHSSYPTPGGVHPFYLATPIPH